MLVTFVLNNKAIVGENAVINITMDTVEFVSLSHFQHIVHSKQ